MNEKSELSNYDNVIDITSADYDLQELLFSADILITDYSSCYLDYLLLNRPIIFYNYDYDTYLINDRELYFDYEEITPGIKVHESDKLIAAIKKSINYPQEYARDRQRVKEIFYSESSESVVCERIMERVKNLN